jgi:hypothetical protein
MPINGVFGLTDSYLNKVENSITKTNLNWSESLGGYGYFSQGITTPAAASATTNITRIEESTGTFSSRPTVFSVAKYERSAVTSQYYAYFCCGANTSGSIITTIDRLDYANETLKTTPEVAPPRISQAQVSTSQFGYVAGGTPGSVSTISRFTFSVETFSTPNSSLLPGNREKVGVTKSYYGAHYVGGTPVNSIYSRLDFSTEMNAVRPSVFPQIVSGLQGISNRFFGYYVGGNAPPLAPIYQSSITRLDFSTESFATSPQVLSLRKNDLASFSLSKFGYFGGGYFTPVATHYSTVERFDFETEVDSALSGGLPVGVSRLTGIEGGYTKETYFKDVATVPVSSTTRRNGFGYFAGGYVGASPAYSSSINSLDFSIDQFSPAAILPSETSSAAVVHNNYYAYVAGGDTASPAPGQYTLTSNIVRYEYVGNTVSLIPTKLPSARFELSGVSALTYGYFAGGIVSPIPSRPFDARSFVSSIIRFDFTTEGTRTYNTKLPEVAAYHTSSYSGSYGYFTGGITETSFASTSITRIDFNSDLLVTKIPGTLPVGRRNMGSVKSGLFAYFAGGEDSTNTLVSTLTKLDFSTETISTSTNLPSVSSSMGSVSSVEYSFGYFFGGTPIPGNGISIRSINFSTETFSSSGVIPGPIQRTSNMTSFESVA